MILELNNISKTYQNSGVSREVLNNISLQINNAESIAIVGPSGSGKSTLLNIMGLLDNANSGIVKFNGEELNNYNENQLAEIRNKKIGFVFQSHHLLPQLSLLENVLLPLIPEKDKKVKEEATKRAFELLEKVGLADKSKQFPGQLSGGESQRTAVVRALINNPELILADEPTGSLDQESANQLGDLLCQINKENKIAVVVVTHSLELANKMNKIYRLTNEGLENN